ncbi:MAG: hypothetical protein M1553_12150, partial [Firmicutes bacterium]|nr:hypothetical protein [Bacillota bacterium]
PMMPPGKAKMVPVPKRLRSTATRKATRAAFFFVPPFTLSSLAGAITGYLVLQAIPKAYRRDKTTP